MSVFPLHPCLGTAAAESTTEKAEMKHHQRTPVGKRRKSPSLLERIQPAAAGIDCGDSLRSGPARAGSSAGARVSHLYHRALPLGRLACAVRDQDGRDGIDQGLLD